MYCQIKQRECEYAATLEIKGQDLKEYTMCCGPNSPKWGEFDPKPFKCIFDKD